MEDFAETLCLAIRDASSPLSCIDQSCLRQIMSLLIDPVEGDPDMLVAMAVNKLSKGNIESAARFCDASLKISNNINVNACIILNACLTWLPRMSRAYVSHIEANCECILCVGKVSMPANITDVTELQSLDLVIDDQCPERLWHFHSSWQWKKRELPIIWFTEGHYYQWNTMSKDNEKALVMYAKSLQMTTTPFPPAQFFKAVLLRKTVTKNSLLHRWFKVPTAWLTSAEILALQKSAADRGHAWACQGYAVQLMFKWRPSLEELETAKEYLIKSLGLGIRMSSDYLFIVYEKIAKKTGKCKYFGF